MLKMGHPVSGSILGCWSRQFSSTRCKCTSRPHFDLQSLFKFTQPPCPTWRLGSGLSTVESSWREEGEKPRKTWDMKNTPPKDAYRLLTSAIVPRPIAFISSLSASGQPNLAPFSYFSMVGHNPPMVSISFNLSPRRPKDTRENILSTKEFTVNIISEPFIEAANSTSVGSPADVNEWTLSGLTMEPSMDVKPALVKESAVGLECELYSYQDIAAPNSSEITTTVILGLIRRVHARTSVLDSDGTAVDPGNLRPVARLGVTGYARLLDAFDMPRISWKAVRDEYEILRCRDTDGRSN